MIKTIKIIFLVLWPIISFCQESETEYPNTAPTYPETKTIRTGLNATATTPPSAPVVTTLDYEYLTDTTVRITGYVDVKGSSCSTWSVVEGDSTFVELQTSSGTVADTIDVDLDSTYNFYFVAKNTTATTLGDSITFTNSTWEFRIYAKTDAYVLTVGGSKNFRFSGTSGKQIVINFGDGTDTTLALTGNLPVSSGLSVPKSYDSGMYQVTVSGDISALYSTYLRASNYIFSIDSLPTNLVQATLYTTDSTIIGDYDNLPSGLTWLWISSDSLSGVTGKVDSLPDGITSLLLNNQPVSGSINNLPVGLTFCEILATTPETSIGDLAYSTRTWPAILKTAWFKDCTLSQTEVDNIICNVDVANILTGSRTLDLRRNTAPSATGAACKVTAVAEGWTIYND